MSLRVTVHTPLSRKVFWHEYAKIPKAACKIPIAEGDFYWLFAHNCEELPSFYSMWKTDHPLLHFVLKTHSLQIWHFSCKTDQFSTKILSKSASYGLFPQCTRSCDMKIQLLQAVIASINVPTVISKTPTAPFFVSLS